MSDGLDVGPIKDTPAPQCCVCGVSLDYATTHTTLELDSSSETVGFTVGHLCESCAKDVQKRMSKAKDDLEI